jgi:hypothetical protein
MAVHEKIGRVKVVIGLHNRFTAFVICQFCQMSICVFRYQYFQFVFNLFHEEDYSKKIGGYIDKTDCVL